MDQRQTLTLWLEIVWWIITGLVVWAVLFPIQEAMYVWPYRGWNIVFVVTLLTLGRYIFLLKHTFLAKRQVLKIVLMLMMFPLAILMIKGLHSFLNYIEENTWDVLTGHLPAPDKKSIEEYIWSEMIFFGVGSVIAPPVFAVRLFISIWRTRNRGTV